MAWNRSASSAKTTAHTCGGPVFGRKTPGCPRCDELLAGAEPVRWGWADNRKAADELARRAGYRDAAAQDSAWRAERIAYCVANHGGQCCGDYS